MTPRHLLKPARLAGSPLLATQSDGRLVDLVRAGSEPAFDAIVSRYRGPLLRYCSTLLGRERAEDAVQQTLVKAFDAMHRDERELNLKAWLYRIAHNTSLNALRDRALRHEELDPERLAAESPAEAVESRARFEDVLAAVQELPPRQRDALVLRELEGRSYEEISEALGVGGGSVRALLHRARHSVRLAATAVTPVGLLLRIPPGLGQGGEGVASRVAELTAGAGASAVATKVAATALVTGAVVGSVAVGPPGGGTGEGQPNRARAAEQQGRNESGTGRSPAAPLPGDDSDSGRDDRGNDDRGDDDDRRERDDDRRGPGRGDDDDDRSGPNRGSDDEDSEREPASSGPGSGETDDAPDDDEDRSGPGDGSDGSGSDGSGSSGSGSEDDFEVEDDEDDD